MSLAPVYLADMDRPDFEKTRMAVDIVCAGDSITGWNNQGPAHFWPVPTYPRFLQEHCEPLGLRVADGGVAGEISVNGVNQVRRYLTLFRNARCCVIGFGTNDLGMAENSQSESRAILRNLGNMVRIVRELDRSPVLLNIPPLQETCFSPGIAQYARQLRLEHNQRLADYCREQEIPLADIFSPLRDEHFADGLHPNEAGARIIAEHVFVALIQVLGLD